MDRHQHRLQGGASEQRKISCLGERGRRTALVLGDGAGDREGIVLLVGGPPGPLRLWLILLILLLHQRDGGGVGKSKRGRGWRPSGQVLAPRLLSLKEEQHMPLSLGRGGTWKLGTAGTFLGRGAWGPVLGPICLPSLLPSRRARVLEKGGVKFPGPTLSYQGPPTPAGDGGNLLGCPKPHPALPPLTWGGSS